MRSISKIAILAPLMALGGCASIPHVSPGQEELAFQVALAADMATTLDIKRHPNIEESNFILGKHPSDSKVLCYWALSGLLHYEVSKAIRANAEPEMYNFWEYATTSIEIGYVAHNYGIGLRVRF